jgi:phenylalanyl-tRNA synthetase alpha subunit
MQALLDDVVRALIDVWGCAVDVQRRSPLVSVEDNYDRLGYAAADLTRDARYSHYVAETVMLRSHTSAGIPAALRELAQQAGPPADVLLVLPGLCYRRDSIDRLHIGTPHRSLCLARRMFMRPVGYTYDLPTSTNKRRSPNTRVMFVSYRAGRWCAVSVRS